MTATTMFLDTAKLSLTRYLPIEISELIINKYVNPPGIAMFQRKVRNYLSLKHFGWTRRQCEDCNHYFWVPPNSDKHYCIVAACSDPCSFNGEYCCWKYKCPWNCVYACTECGKPVVSHHFEWVDSIHCPYCHSEIKLNCVWNGLSPDEYRMKYG